MRAVQIALVIISIQIGLGIIVESGMFSGTFYESTLTKFDMGPDTSAGSEAELLQKSVGFMNKIYNAMTWNWIKDFFQPYYSLDTGLKYFIDHIVLLLQGISGFVIAVAFIEFVRNRIDVLGG